MSVALAMPSVGLGYQRAMVDKDAKERLRSEADDFAAGFRAGMAARVKAERDLRGWTQHDLAGEAGVSVGTIQGCESGDRNPEPANAFLLAKALGHSIRWLYFGEE